MSSSARTSKTRWISFEEFVAWWEKGGKLSASEKFDLKWKQMGAAFDRVLKGALAASGIK